MRLSLERMAREDRGHTLGAPAVWRQYLGGAAMAAEGRTLAIDLARPMADFADVLAQAFVADPACLPALDRGDRAALEGSGAYRIAGASAGRVEAEAAPGRAPANPRIAFEAVPSAEARLARLRGGGAQAATVLPVAASRALGPGFTRIEHLAPVAIIYLMNAARGPLADPRLRRALSLALDRAAIVREVMEGAARPLHAIVSPLHFGATGSEVPHDPAAARALLKAAGAEGLRLGVDCPTRLPDEAERLTAAVAAQLAAVGVSLDVRLHEDREAYAHMVRRKEIQDLAVFDSSPLSTARVLHEKIDGRVRGAWWEGYSNREVEAAIDAARAETDDAARAALYRAACEVMQADPPWLTLYNPMRAAALAGAHEGVAMPVTGVLDVAALPALGGPRV